MLQKVALEVKVATMAFPSSKSLVTTVLTTTTQTTPFLQKIHIEASCEYLYSFVIVNHLIVCFNLFRLLRHQ